MVSSGKDEKNRKEQKRRLKVRGIVSKEEMKSKKKREMKRRGEESNVGTLKQSNTIKITFYCFIITVIFFFLFLQRDTYFFCFLLMTHSFSSLFFFFCLYFPQFFFVGWTAVTMDGSRSAQFEHTMLVTESGVEILTGRVGQPTDRILWDAECFKR